MKYDELGYSPPKITANAAAKRAIDVLEGVAELDAGCLFYLMQASNVLALAGLRAQSPYNEFEPSFDTGRQASLAKLLHERGCEIMYDSDPYDDNKRSTFSVMCTQVFEELPQSYRFISTFWKEPQNVGDLTDFVFWGEHFQMALVQQMQDSKLPKDWLADWWAPHNIRFGMLLGYPGQAISAGCWHEARYNQGKRTTRELKASLPFQGVYFGTHVGYEYAPDLRDDPVIKDHQALWSSVLTRVYEVFSEDRVIELPSFMEAYDAYKKYYQADRLT